MGIADLLKLQQHRGEITHENLVSLAVYLTVETLQPAVVVILARSGATARRVARFGLSQWIVAPSHIESTCRRLQLSRGVYPAYVPDPGSLATLEARRQYAWELLHQHGLDHGLVLLIEGSGTLKARDTQRIDIVDLG